MLQNTTSETTEEYKCKKAIVNKVIERKKYERKRKYWKV